MGERVGTEPSNTVAVPGPLRALLKASWGMPGWLVASISNLLSSSPPFERKMGAHKVMLLAAILERFSWSKVLATPLSSDISPWLLLHFVGGFLGSP